MERSGGGLLRLTLVCATDAPVFVAVVCACGLTRVKEVFSFCLMEDEHLCGTPWLSLREKVVRRGDGSEKRWTYARREGTAGAVCVLAHAGGPTPRLLLVRQFRPPVGREVLEFPAGLLDEGESAEQAALRELREETGWIGEVVRVGPRIPSSPGMTDEWVCMVEVRLTHAEDAAPDGDEAITPVWLECRGLRERLEAIDKEGVMIDAKLWSFAVGTASSEGGGKEADA